MSTKRNPFIHDSYLSENSSNNKMPYRARNFLSRNNNEPSTHAQEITLPQQEQIQDLPDTELPPGDVPALPAEPGAIPQETEEAVGYISVGVFTASGALPVKDAVVTVYELSEDGEEYVLYHVVTDASGQIPVLELPVEYDRFNPYESFEYFFSTYNLRVQAINYYNYNLLDIRVFPNTTTNFMVELIPTPAGPGVAKPETTFVIPPSPIDISND